MRLRYLAPLAMATAAAAIGLAPRKYAVSVNATAGLPVEENVEFRNATYNRIGLAPVAGAAPTGPSSQCTSTGNSTVCQRPGHVGIVNSPPAVSRPLYPVLPYPVGPLLFGNG
jgi:hypothetical protein